MTSFRVTPSELTELSHRVRDTAGGIESSLSALRGRVGPVGASWSGPAHDRFDGLYDAWNHAAEELQHALAGISALLAQAGDAYDEAESRIAGSFTN